MVAIVTNAFGGERPITQPRLLGESDAQLAKNVRLVTGRIESLKGTTNLKALTVAATTIFRYGNSATEGNYWCEWADEVHAIRSPIAADSYDRLYWTGEGWGGSSSYPRYAPNSLVISGAVYPGGSYRLGIPKPSATPSASGTAVVEYATVNRDYVLTFVNAASNPSAESLPSVVYTVSAVDGKDVKFTDLTTDNRGDSSVTHKRLYRKVSGTYRLVTTLELATKEYTDTATDASLASAEALSSTLANAVTAPKTAPTVSSASVVTPTQATNTYVVTFTAGVYVDGNNNSIYISESLPSSEVVVSSVYSNQTVNLTNLTVPSGVTFSKFRIYRKVTGESYFRFIGETSGSTFSDTSLTATDATYNSDLYADQTKKPNTPSAAKDAGYASQSTETRVYCVTFVNGSSVESPASPASNAVTVYNGNAVTVSHVDAIPSGVTLKRIYRKLDGGAVSTYRRVAEIPASQYSYTDTSLNAAISGNASIPAGLQNVLVTPTGIPLIEAVIPEKVAPETRVYCITYVSAYGEEGPPSDASTAIDIDPNKSVTVTGLGSAPSGAYNITLKRLYRSSTVGNAAQFQLVPVSWTANGQTVTGVDIPVAITSVTDASAQDDLQETLPSETWEAPPDKLFGLRIMANGIAAGFVRDNGDRTVRLSEPYLPHAWPAEYSFTTDDPIVGLGTFRQSVAVLTKSFPYVISCVDPASATMTKLELRQGCVSRRSIVETGDGVLYASPDGLISVGDGGVQNITAQLFSRDQWQAFNPSSMLCQFHDGRIHIVYKTVSGTAGMLILDASGQGALLTQCDINATADINGMYQDPATDTLYLIQNSYIARFNTGSDLTYTWRSKLYRTPYPLNFSCGQVLAETYPVTLKVYADGALKLTKSVADAKLFTLPAGFRAFDWYYEVSGTAKVFSVSIAQSVAEIKGT